MSDTEQRQLKWCPECREAYPPEAEKCEEGHTLEDSVPPMTAPLPQ